MLRFIRKVFKKKAEILGPYKGYIGSVEHNGKSGLYQGRILNVPHFWNDRIKTFPELVGKKGVSLEYSAINKEMLEIMFKNQVDYLVEIIESFWQNQKL